MFSYQFLIKNEAPWGESKTELDRQVQLGRDHLVAGRLKDAIQSLPTQKVWGLLLRCYIWEVCSEFLSDASKRKSWEKRALEDYAKAQLLNRALADEQFTCYKFIKNVSKQVLLVASAQKQKINFAKLQAQAWYCYCTDKLNAQGQSEEALQICDQGLQEMPANHVLHFSRHLIYFKMASPTSSSGCFNSNLLSQAEEEMTKAVQICPSVPEASNYISRHYFHRGQIRLLQLKLLADEKEIFHKRFAIISDFQNTLSYDSIKYGDITREKRIEVLAQILTVYPLRNLIKRDLAQKFQDLHSQINHRKSNQDPPAVQVVGPYIERSDIYNKCAARFPNMDIGLMMKSLARLDCSIAYWLLRLGIDPTPEYSRQQIEARLNALPEENKDESVVALVAKLELNEEKNEKPDLKPREADEKAAPLRSPPVEGEKSAEEIRQDAVKLIAGLRKLSSDLERVKGLLAQQSCTDGAQGVLQVATLFHEKAFAIASTIVERKDQQKEKMQPVLRQLLEQAQAKEKLKQQAEENQRLMQEAAQKQAQKNEQNQRLKEAKQIEQQKEKLRLVLQQLCKEAGERRRQEAQRKHQAQKQAREEKEKEAREVKRSHKDKMKPVLQQLISQAEEKIKHQQQLEKQTRRQRNKEFKEAEERKQEVAAVVEGLVVELEERERLEQDNMQVVTVLQELLGQVEEKAKQEEDQRVQQRLAMARNEDKYYQEESTPFAALRKLSLPLPVIATGRRLKALPGRLAKRTILYGGTARDEAFMLDRQKFDFDLRTALPLAMVAPILKEVFGLNEVPEEKHAGILSVSFALNPPQDTRLAVLTVSHSEHLANEELSYFEALRYDMLSLDFIQNAFIATFSRQDEFGSVHYPLNEWRIYSGCTLRRMYEQMKNENAHEHLSEAVTNLTCPTLFFIGRGNPIQVYFYVEGKIVRLKNKFSLTFQLKLTERDSALLATNNYGRVVVTRKNQARILALLSEINEQYQTFRYESLDCLKGRIVERLSALGQLETILEPKFSFAYDPLRLLRLIHYTTALGCKRFSQSLVEAAAAQNQQTAYLAFMNTNPGRVNSWMNKIFCRDGKDFIIDNFYNLRDLGNLLELSFPTLIEAILANESLWEWLYQEFVNINIKARASVNHLYSLFIHCLCLHKQEDAQTIVAANALFSENFREVAYQPYLEEVNRSWETFCVYQQELFAQQQSVSEIQEAQPAPTLLAPHQRLWVPRRTPTLPPQPGLDTQTLSFTH